MISVKSKKWNQDQTHYIICSYYAWFSLRQSYRTSEYSSIIGTVPYRTVRTIADRNAFCKSCCNLVPYRTTKVPGKEPNFSIVTFFSKSSWERMENKIPLYHCTKELQLSVQYEYVCSNVYFLEKTSL